MAIKLNDNYLKGFIGQQEYTAIQPQVSAAHKMLCEKNGPGNDFLGWTTLPNDYDKAEFAQIKESAEKIKKSCDVFIVIGIGGSYLGARAVIEY
ncbi:MAG: glucose-6-phosphate isomerase, partial [Clostridia bacterium]|nr:glucose-6-phosphate isomerase [Clostridia bacterium]